MSTKDFNQMRRMAPSSLSLLSSYWLSQFHVHSPFQTTSQSDKNSIHRFETSDHIKYFFNILIYAMVFRAHRFLPSIWETFPFAPSYHHSIQQLSLQLQPFSRVEKKKNVLPFAVIFGVLFFIRKVILMMEVTIIAIIFIRSEQFCTIFFFFTPTEIT